MSKFGGENHPHESSAHAKDEHAILDYWEEHSIFEKSVENRSSEKSYVFYDGPPFATGLPHYGHIVASVMKDVAPRFWTMKGYRVERTWGWDCHGLPIENIIEKEKNLESRKDIEDFGIENFNEACHNTVLTYAEEWKKTIRRLGRWVDMENSYKTMDLPFMESIWWVFKELWDKGLIYEGHKPMHICPRCETALSNFEVNQNYQDAKDISVFVTFPLKDGAHAGANLIAWTTTPWTLPGNILAAVGSEIAYVKVKSDDGEFILGKDAYERLQKDNDWPLKDTEIISELKGSDLLGVNYEPLFPFFAEQEGFRVVAGDFVTTEDGTGIVHIAPGFGEDDMKLGEAEGVEPILHVQMNGEMLPEVVEGFAKMEIAIAGMPVKKKGDTQSLDVQMIRALAGAGRLVWKQKIEHSYPHCWRCDTPLLNYATNSWFVRVTDIKEMLVANNQEINWVPDNMKEGRFGKWLENARDWAVSRSRYWGTPLPVWRSEDGDLLCIGSVEELKELAGLEELTDLHKHTIDKIEITKDGKTYTRIPEVLDCWFESGSMPYAQLHYPFENKDKFENGFPAEFIAEGQDQTRGWFYTLHVLGTALFGKPAFKNCVVNGIVLAEDGKKMSKRLQNYPDPMDVIEGYGSDSVRYYLASSPVMHAENLRFSEKGVDEVNKKFVLISRNVIAFYELYKDLDDGREPALTYVLDKWIMARLYQTLKEETEALEAYDFAGAARPLQAFVTDLSQWYVRRSRERVKSEGEFQAETIATLRTVLNTFSKMCAPFMPFLAEKMYQAIEGDFKDSRRMSVHLEDWPELNEALIDQSVLGAMGQTRSVVTKALEKRVEAGINVRQPLQKATVTSPEGELVDAYVELIKEEVNIKEVEVQKGDYAVELDTKLSPELIREGVVREIIRRVNSMRKKAGLTLDDRIALYVQGDEEVVKAATEHHHVLMHGTLASDFRTDGEAPGNTENFRTQELEVTVGFEKGEIIEG